MPNSENEQGLLGCILLKPEVLKNVSSSVEDFFNVKNREIYKTLNKLDVDDKEINIVTVYQAMGISDIAPYLAALTSEVVNSSFYKQYDLGVREFSAKRKLSTLAKTIDQMSKNGKGAQEILEKIQEVSQRCAEKLGKKKKSVIGDIRDFLNLTEGNINITDYNKWAGGFLTKVTKQHQSAVLMAFNRLVKEGVLEKVKNYRGLYRKIEQDFDEIDFMSANPEDIFDVKWPFGLEYYVNLLPKSIVILAGTWDAGKTAFLLNVIHLNQDRHKIRYMSSEMGAEELRLRLDRFEEVPPDWWKFQAIEKSSDWQDAILPDGLNLIDYLEISSDFFSVGEPIRKIYDKLDRGIAVIAIQKAPGKALGRGGDFTAEKARLYLSLDKGELTISKGKLWASQINPRGLTWKFKLWQGHKFVAQGEPFKKVQE